MPPDTDQAVLDQATAAPSKPVDVTKYSGLSGTKCTVPIYWAICLGIF